MTRSTSAALTRGSYRILLATGLALMLGACTESDSATTAGESRGQFNLTVDDPQVVTQSICDGVSLPVDATCWPAGTNITVGYSGLTGSPDGNTIRDAVQSAVAGWSNKLVEGTSTGSPTLSAPGATGTVTIYVRGTAAQYCGETVTRGNPLRPDSVIMTATNVGTVCSNKNVGSLAIAIRHELAHVLGWGVGHGGSDARSASFTQDCVTFLPKKVEGNFIPAGVCHHEVEPIFRAYAQQSLGADFYTSPIIYRTDVLPRFIDSLAPQNSQQLSLSAWTWNDETASPPVRSWGDHSVGSSNPGFATVTSGGLITGVAVGTAKIRLLPSDPGTPPAGTTFWTPFRLLGDSVVVQVKAPTPLPLQVTAITFAETPATTAGEHVGTAVLSDPNSSAPVSWRVVHGTAPLDTLRSTGPTATVTVPWGASYRITFIARVNGFDTYQDLPVCTTGQQVRAEEPGPGGETDAVGGC